MADFLLITSVVLAFLYATTQFTVEKLTEKVYALENELEKTKKEKKIKKKEQQISPLLEMQETRLKKIEEVVTEFAKQRGFSNEFYAVRKNERMELVLPERLFFESGKATLLPEAKQFLIQLVPLFKHIPNQIEIEGHTDNLPLRSSSPFDTNWELSAHRATQVVRFLIENHELEPKQLAAIGYGEFRPIADNKTEEGRLKNRRVVITISAEID
jgi:chemotaxis protein MotB